MLIIDDDECENGTAKCSEGTYCENTPGKFACKGTQYSEPTLSIRHVSSSCGFSFQHAMCLVCLVAMALGSKAAWLARRVLS